LLKPSWQIVCHVSSLERSGDFVTLDVARQRRRGAHLAGRDSGIHNVCQPSRRAHPEGAGNCRAPSPVLITLAYKLSGELLGMTARERPSRPWTVRSSH